MPHLPSVTFRRAARYSVGVGAAVVALLTTACADATAPAAPRRSAAPGAALPSIAGAPLPTSGTALGVARLVPLAHDVKASAIVTRARGGTVTLPGTGLRVVVPAGAIRPDRLTITVTAPAGRAVAYHFEPHGTQFTAPLTIEQDYRGLLVSGLVDLNALYVGYFATPDAFDPLTGVAVVSEEIPVQVDLKRKVASFPVNHFSGYMLSSGRKR